MEKIEEKDLTVRAARPDDVISILDMVRELADFEKLGDEMIATEADYQESLFGEKPAAEALVAELEGSLIGYAIYFSTFSTFVGRTGIWLEDLYVRQFFRKQGVGRHYSKQLVSLRKTEMPVATNGVSSTGTRTRSTSTSRWVERF